jgi:hypothetical protein
VTVLFLGLLAPRSGLHLRGTFAGPPDRSEALRTATLQLADRAATARELLDGLSTLARQTGYVLETGAPRPDEISFYLWDQSAG